MPERKRTFTATSEVVQGEGSFVTFRKVSYGQLQQARKLAAEGTLTPEQNEQYGRDWLARSIVAWNWVDDQGQPLPLPAAGLDIDVLTNEEANWLMAQLIGEAQAKN